MEPIIHHPFAYPLGPVDITGFGLAVLLAFLVAQVIATRELARRGHDPSPIPDLILAAVIGGLLGAKIYYVILFGGSILSRAGFVFWGGLIGGILAVTAMIRVRRIPLAPIADVAGICIAAAYAVGRTGCWAVGDDYGRPWNSSLAVAFPEGAPPSTARYMSEQFGVAIPADVDPGTVISVYPTQLFEVAMGMMMFLMLWRLRGHRHLEGWLFGVYCMLAGVERIIIEFFRAKDDRIFGAFTVAQLIALGFVALGAAIVASRNGNRPQPATA